MFSRVIGKLRGRKEPKTDFSSFFAKTSAEQRVNLYRKAINQANKEQRDLLEKWGISNAPAK